MVMKLKKMIVDNQVGMPYNNVSVFLFTVMY